ncbi:MAG: hypothetical protein ACKVHB_06870, partial [Pseudomonadales bacterium]
MKLNKRNKKQIFEGFRYSTLTIWLLIVAFPLFWIIGTSFKPDAEWFAWPPVYWSDTPTLSNYANVWMGKEELAVTQYAQSMQKPWKALGNSTLVAMVSTS